MYGVIPLFPVNAFMECIGTNSLLCYLCNFRSYRGEYGRYGEEVHTGLWRESLKEIYHIENIGIIVRIILKCVLNRVGRRSMY
jgi:hypothetical protein